MIADMVAGNPFLVLECAPEASRLELERQAQLLLGMLELGFAAAQTYPTPLGPRPRTADAVRSAVATLRDPQKRLTAELWARHLPPPCAAAPDGEPNEPNDIDAPAAALTLPGARGKLGWGG